MGNAGSSALREPWNKGKIVGQKAPFKLKDIWAMRVRLQMESRVRELALFQPGHRQQAAWDATSLPSRSETYAMATRWRRVPSSCSTRRSVRFSSRSRRPLVTPYKPGSSWLG